MESVSECPEIAAQRDSPWGNVYIESFNGKPRGKFLDREIFDAMLEAMALTERWRQEYNTVRPHSSPGSRPSAPDAQLFASHPPNLHSMPENQWKFTRENERRIYHIRNGGIPAGGSFLGKPFSLHRIGPPQNADQSSCIQLAWTRIRRASQSLTCLTFPNQPL